MPSLFANRNVPTGSAELAFMMAASKSPGVEAFDAPLPSLSREVTVGTAGGDLSYVRYDGVTVTIPAAVLTNQPVQAICAQQINSGGAGVAGNVFVKC